MGATDRSALSQLSTDDQTVSEVIDSLDLSGVPIRERGCSLHRNKSSLRVTIMADAWQDQDIRPSDAPAVDQYYFPDTGFLLVDLNTNE
jgi:hypothetical protein